MVYQLFQDMIKEVHLLTWKTQTHVRTTKKDLKNWETC